MSTSRIRKSRTARIVAAVAVATAGTVTGSLVSVGTSHAATAIGVSSDDGSYVTAVTGVDSRMFDLSIYSAAMKTTLHARVIVPQSFFTNTTKTYPSLYLLSGSGDAATDWEDWTLATPIEGFMANRDVMTVMPQDGSAGNYTDWLNTSNVFTAAKPAWETFHTTELPQLMARNYRTNTTMAIAGISEAGIGVIDYPARHPGEYTAAASFSGMLNTQVAGSVATVEAEEVRANDNTDGPWGDPITNSSVWAAHNPVNLIPQLKTAGTSIWLGCGNGQQGPGDLPFALDSYIYEQNALSQAQGFAKKAIAAGVPTVTDFYGAGEHNWPAWIRAFPNAWSTTLAPGLGVPV
jgi:S-formylglutathione hydrolase FrmB